MTALRAAFMNKKGSFAVFAAMAFSSVMIMVIAAINSAHAAAISSKAECYGNLWCKSILGEYDIILKERYGLFAFYGNNYETAGKINFYAENSFGDKSYIRYKGTEVSLEGYELTDTAVLKRQIEKVILSGYKSPVTDIDESRNPEGENTDSDRDITASWIIRGLPSQGHREKFDMTGTISKIKAGAGIKNIAGRTAVDMYILTFFKDCMESRDLKSTYFNCEVEYILTGRLSDTEAKKKAAVKIKGLRNALNLYYLYTCSEKREAAMALAQTVMPGPGAVLVQAVILESWAYAEAENDVKILYDKKTVPLLKKDSDWALSLENVFADETAGKYIAPASISDKGYGQYEDYIRILLCGMSEETKLLRVMDLIQVNMKYSYYGSFLLKDYHTGLDYEITVNGEKHEFKDSY